MKKYKRARCAITGRFVTLQEAAQRPETTVVETVSIKSPSRRKPIDD